MLPTSKAHLWDADQACLAALSGALGVVFEGLRWPGWQDEVAPLALSQGIALDPPPYSRRYSSGHGASLLGALTSRLRNRR